MARGEALLETLGERLSGLRGRITPDAPMDKITWFRAGGLADALFQPADEEDLAEFLKAVPEEVPQLQHTGTPLHHAEVIAIEVQHAMRPAGIFGDGQVDTD